MMNNKPQLTQQLIKTGCLFYGIGIVAFGVQQLVIKDFRPEILPSFPAWPHKYVIFPYITGIALIFVGIITTGLFKTKIKTENICAYLGFYFLMLIIFCHLPYTLILSPNKASHLGVWAQCLKELAYCGGAFVMAGSFAENPTAKNKKNLFELLMKNLIPFGRIFFATTMILFGYAHFVYTSYVSAMVPKCFGVPDFWTYFGGAALIASGIAIILKIWIRPIALLLALMLFLWFIFLHVPDAIRNPSLNNGNEIVSAFDALLFCGTALIIGLKIHPEKTLVKQ